MVSEAVNLEKGIETEGDFTTSVDLDVDGEDTESVTNIQGMRLSSPQKGINIIRMTDGTTKKILIK